MSINTERMLIIAATFAIVGVLMAIQLGKLSNQMVVAQDLAEELQEEYMVRQASVGQYIRNEAESISAQDRLAQR